MAKKFFPRALSVGLSLALCAGMVLPSFAAQVLNNEAINWSGEEGYKTGTLKGYEEDGQTKYDYYLENDLELEGALSVGKDEEGNAITASIDLNGYELALNKNLDMDQELELNTTPTAEKHGSVIAVVDGASLTVYGNKEDDKDYDRGEGKGSITGGTGSVGWQNTASNDWSGNGGGVKIYNGGSFSMYGGEITKNIGSGHGGGVSAWDGTVVLDGVEISSNKIYGNGSAIWCWGNTTAEVSNCLIEKNVNTATSVIHGDLKGLKVTDSVIRGNTSDSYLGLHFEVVNTSYCNNSNGAGGLKEGCPMAEDHHVWGTSVVEDTPSTCKTHGVGHHVCKSGCVGEPVELELDPNNHEGGTEVRNAADPTYDAPGYSGDIYCSDCGELIQRGEAIAMLVRPADPEDEIENQAIPLASGPITRAEFIDYLWRHEGEPASEGVCTFTDVTEEHEYFAALCWADENGVAEAYFSVEGHEDGTFEPDELVTVAAVREFLGNYETVFGTQAVAAAELASLTGADDEAVLNCDEVLAEFFGEEYVPAVDEAA